MTTAKTQFITLFGKQYKVRCPAGQETILKQTEDMLNQQILETKKNSGLTNREDIVMMTALNLCSQAVEQQIQAEKEKHELAASQASAMMNEAPSIPEPPPHLQKQSPPQAPAHPKPGQGSPIAEAASKASQILKDGVSE